MCYPCRSFSAVGVDPSVMGIGPAVAIPAAVKSAGLQIDDINLFEINEVLVPIIAANIMVNLIRDLDL